MADGLTIQVRDVDRDEPTGGAIRRYPLDGPGLILPAYAHDCLVLAAPAGAPEEGYHSERI